jgi:hypothetical protein
MTPLVARYAASLLIFGAFHRVAAQDSTATVRGFVTSSGDGVAGAAITVRGSNITGTSGNDGAFRISGIPAGAIVLDVKRLGYVAEEFHLTLKRNDDRKVNLVLDKVAQALPQVTVTDIPGTPARLAQSHKYDDFYIRKATGIGTFITREEIDRQFKATTQELLQAIPGILIRQTGTTWWVQFTRCGRAKVPGTITSGGPSEPVQVFVDGQFASNGTDRLEEINPAEIEAIEIYKGPSQLPAIARGKGCGAIFIWLRDGSR